mmetsp:Transcript_35400/g.86202  ORF Transcript_35400/g.86202 Transcript_35400/m.86202 type:complete len:263 (-) Transcript_35400:162-950(-)
MSDSDVVPADCLSIQEIGTVAGVFLIIAWVALLVTGLFMALKAMQVESESKKFYYLNAFICAVACYSYFAMFSGMGWQTVMGCRQFFYIRYVDWAVTTPLTILSLGILAGQDYATVFAVMGADVGMILAGYLGSVALVPAVKWLWFLLGLGLFVLVFLGIAREFRQCAIDHSDAARIELYSRVSLLVLISWSLYPVVWVLTSGSGMMGVSLESILYAILDCVAKVWFSFAIINHSGPYSSDAPIYSYKDEPEQQDGFERQYV